MLPLLQFDYMDAFVDWETQQVLEFNNEAITLFQDNFL